MTDILKVGHKSNFQGEVYKIALYFFVVRYFYCLKIF